jgi:hypothetical protein
MKAFGDLGASWGAVGGFESRHFMQTPKELQNQIEASLKALRELQPSDNFPHVVTASRHIAEVLAASSQLAEISTRRLERRTDKLIYLTWALVFLTFGLLILTLVLVKFH